MRCTARCSRHVTWEGDFFDVMYLNDGRVGLAVADVSDKGVPAALFMMSSRTLLKGAAIGVGLPR